MPRSPFAHAAAALAEVCAVAQERVCSPASVALAWVLAHPGVSSALIGVHSTAQLDALLAGAALDRSLTDIRRLKWRWRITGERPPDDELDGLTDHDAPDLGCASAPAATNNENVNA